MGVSAVVVGCIYKGMVEWTAPAVKVGTDATILLLLSLSHLCVFYFSRFRGLLQRQQRSALEPKIDAEMLSHLFDQTLERQLVDEEVARLLILADLPQRHSSRTVAMRLLHAAGWKTPRPRCMRRQPHARCLASAALSDRLLCSSHLDVELRSKLNCEWIGPKQIFSTVF